MSALSPETLAAVAAEARSVLAAEPHEHVIMSCLLALLDEREALLAVAAMASAISGYEQAGSSR